MNRTCVVVFSQMLALSQCKFVAQGLPDSYVISVFRDLEGFLFKNLSKSSFEHTQT